MSGRRLPSGSRIVLGWGTTWPNVDTLAPIHHVVQGCGVLVVGTLVQACRTGVHSQGTKTMCMAIKPQFASRATQWRSSRRSWGGTMGCIGSLESHLACGESAEPFPVGLDEVGFEVF